MKNYQNIEEMVAVRNLCYYEAYEEEPKHGPYYAVRALPVSFPGEHEALTADGVAVEQWAIVACERNVHGRWIWCNLTPAAKRVFGDIIFDNDLDRNKWWYIVERPMQHLSDQ